MIIIFLFIFNFFGLEKYNSLYVGESINLDSSNISKITVTNSKVIKVEKLKDSRILINAKRKGTASLHIKYKNYENFETYHFSILSADVYRRYRAINSTLKKFKDVTVKVAGEFLYITGYVDAQSDLDLIVKLCSNEKNNINLVKISNASLSLRENEIFNNLSRLALNDIDYKNIDGVCFIRGICKNEADKKRVESYIKNILPACNLEINLIPYQVDINIKIIETSNNVLNEFGLELPATYTLTRKTVISNIEMDSILHINVSKGFIKTVASPALTSNNGEKAIFQAGGEFPIKLSTRYDSNLTWKQYGVILSFTPQVINDNTVSIKIESEFSDIDDSRSVENLPGITKKNVNTIITVETGKSLVISGLIKKSKTRVKTGYPLLSSIPILSYLFSNNRENFEDTELAMIITPNIRYRGEEKEIFRKLDELYEEVYKLWIIQKL